MPRLTHLNGQELQTHYRWLAPCYGISLTGHPAISIPCGVDDEGMPFGLQVVGPSCGGRRLLAIARALEEASASDPELARPRPDPDQLREPVPALTSIVTAPPDSGSCPPESTLVT